MPKQIHLIIGGFAVVTLIAIIAGVLVYTQLKKQQEKTAQKEPAPKNSINSLLAAGKNQTCEVSYLDESGSGTIYIADQKIRGDFKMKARDKLVDSSTIRDNNYTYLWTGTEGSKMKVSETVKEASAGTTAFTFGQDFNKELTFKCSDWTVDSTKFEPPKDVKFSEGSDIMKKQPAASFCEIITNPQAKSDCLKNAQ